MSRPAPTAGAPPSSTTTPRASAATGCWKPTWKHSSHAKNDDYFGSDLEQKPLYRLQAFASYDFSQSTYGALKLVHADGGELKLQGHTLDDTHQRYTQLGFELATGWTGATA